VDGRVVKRYRGSDASERLRNEVDAIRRAAGLVPARRSVTFARLRGRNGQELIDEGFGDGVLEAAGRTLRALCAKPMTLPRTHGDYGPQNLLYDEAATGFVIDRAAEPRPSPRLKSEHPEYDLVPMFWAMRSHRPSA
jgi:hypothetical protein